MGDAVDWQMAHDSSSYLNKSGSNKRCISILKVKIIVQESREDHSIRLRQKLTNPECAIFRKIQQV